MATHLGSPSVTAEFAPGLEPECVGRPANPEFQYKTTQLDSPAIDASKTLAILQRYGSEGWLLAQLFSPNGEYRSAAAMLFKGADWDSITWEYRIEPLTHLARDTSGMDNYMSKIGKDGWLLACIYQGGHNLRYSSGIFVRRGRSPVVAKVEASPKQLSEKAQKKRVKQELAAVASDEAKE